MIKITRIPANKEAIKEMIAFTKEQDGGTIIELETDTELDVTVIHMFAIGNDNFWFTNEMLEDQPNDYKLIGFLATTLSKLLAHQPEEVREQILRLFDIETSVQAEVVVAEPTLEVTSVIPFKPPNDITEFHTIDCPCKSCDLLAAAEEATWD